MKPRESSGRSPSGRARPCHRRCPPPPLPCHGGKPVPRVRLTRRRSPHRGMTPREHPIRWPHSMNPRMKHKRVRSLSKKRRPRSSSRPSLSHDAPLASWLCHFLRPPSSCPLCAWCRPSRSSSRLRPHVLVGTLTRTCVTGPTQTMKRRRTSSLRHRPSRSTYPSGSACTADASG